jgi:hypothetical protein
MDATSNHHENPDCNRQDHYAKAGYAAEAVVHLMSKEGFSSAEVRELFQARCSFMSRLHRSKEGFSTDDNRFLGAVLSKLAQRGTPASCSLMVEHYILQKAQDAGLLIFEESIESGKIKFSCMPLMKDFDLMLRICCLPELLVEDSQVDLLLQDYETLLEDSEPKKRFFDKLMSALPDKRLALFVVPCGFMGQDFGKGFLKSEEQADFVIQIPNFKRKTLLRIAIQLGASLDHFDKEDGWIVKRFGHMMQQYWESEIRKLADQIVYTIPDDILTAAKQLREMPPEKKNAIQELISLPIAEAQLTQAIAGLIYMGEKAEIVIGNPQNLDLGVVMEAIREMIDASSSLYGIPNPIELRLADDSTEPDLEYYSMATGVEFSCACIAPRPICSYRGSIKLDAIPRPINRSASKTNVRKNLRFFLNNIFRIQEFQEDQAELIEQMLSLHGSIGLLKPGGGKTLAYQLASILQPGIALVIVPTRHMAMIRDYDLTQTGIHTSRIIFGPDEEWPQDPQISMDRSESNILILAVDTFQDLCWRTRLRDIFSNCISFLILDEVHAISEWSNGFQPGYLNVVRWARENCAIMGAKPSLIALTSNRSRLVLLDIINELGLEDFDCIIESTSYDRKNLKYELYKVNGKNRMPILISALKATLREYGGPGNNPKVPCGLIVCAHEDDEVMGLISLSKSLRSYLNKPVGVCSVEPPKKFLRLGGSRDEWMRASCKALLQFLRNELPILICSMDTAIQLDKKDIRFILHANMPASLDEFCRQSGRAGHDGLKSSCIILSSEDSDFSGDKDIARYYVDSRNREPLAEEFPGKVMEKRILSWVVLKLLSSSSSSNIGDKVDFEIFISSSPFLTKDIKMPSERKQRLLEKALHRLLLLGAINGYERRAGSFKLTTTISEASHIYWNYKRYINRYETEGLAALYLPKERPSTYKNAVLKCGCRLIDYSYYKIKTKKEDDLARMLQATEAGLASLRNFQDSVHDFTERSEVEARLTLVESESWWRVLDDISGLDDLLDLHLACRRKIKWDPDNPALRIIAGFCAMAFQDKGQRRSDFAKGLCSLKDLTTEAYRTDMCRQIFSHAELLMPSQKDLILRNIWQTHPSLEVSRFCYEKSESSNEICYSSLFKLVNSVLGAFNAGGVIQ